MSENLSGYDAYLLTALYKRVALDDGTGCINWTGPQGGSRAYDSIRFRGKTTRTHRLAYQSCYGPIPAGFELDHLCRNTLCLNVQHLEPVTHKENIRRGLTANQTHCKRGHLLSGYNVYFTPKAPTRRNCRACNNIRNSKSKKRRKGHE